MAETYNPAILQNFVYKGKEASNIKEIPTRYFRMSFNCFPAVKIIHLEELSDSEILNLSEKMGTFSFLNSPEEDIYTLSDGKPIE